MSLLMIVVVLDLGNIFNFLFDGVGISTYCWEAVATIILLATLALRTSLVLVFLASLALVGKKLLVLVTRYVSGRSISGLSLFGVLIFLFCGPIPLKILKVHLASA